MMAKTISESVQTPRLKSIEELAAEQGVTPIKRLEDVLGKGKDLWANDDEFDSFLSGIYERRREASKSCRK